MKSIRHTLAGPAVAAALALAVPCIGQAQQQALQPASPSGAGPAIARAGGMIGMPVIDALGYEVARVDDLVISADWSIDQVVLQIGGMHGVGSRRVAVSLAEFQVTSRALVLPTADRESLARLPAFERSRFVQPINLPGAPDEVPGAAPHAGLVSASDGEYQPGLIARVAVRLKADAADVATFMATSAGEQLQSADRLISIGWHRLGDAGADAWDGFSGWLGAGRRDADNFLSELAREIGATMHSSHRANTYGM